MLYLRSTVQALQSQIDDLRQRLDASEQERKDLLDRLLSRNNVEPLRQSEPARATAPPIQYIAPFGVQPAEIEQPLRDSWIEEETAYVMQTTGMDWERSHAEAQRRYIGQHRTIGIN